MAISLKRVRFTPESGHSPGGLGCPLSLRSGHSSLRCDGHVRLCQKQIYEQVCRCYDYRTHGKSWSGGSVRLKITKVGFIVGGGSGTLTFKGKRYRLSISGVSAGTIGVAGADLVGTASNLRTASDIVGTYSALSAGVAVAGGSNGVVLQLQGRQVGFSASLSVSGLTISLQ
jgi:hypothetical protein